MSSHNFKLTPIRCHSCGQKFPDSLKDKMDNYLEKRNMTTTYAIDVSKLDKKDYSELDKIYDEFNIDCQKCKLHLLTDIGIQGLFAT